MRSLLAIGTLLVLLSGAVPAHAVHAWFFDGPLCREACAGTDHCCCKKRQLGRGGSHGDDRPVIVETPRASCCPDDCATATALQRPLSSRTAYRAEFEQPLPETSLHEPDAIFAPRCVRIAPARPRAPPA